MTGLALFVLTVSTKDRRPYCCSHGGNFPPPGNSGSSARTFATGLPPPTIEDSTAHEPPFDHCTLACLDFNKVGSKEMCSKSVSDGAEIGVG